MKVIKVVIIILIIALINQTFIINCPIGHPNCSQEKSVAWGNGDKKIIGEMEKNSDQNKQKHPLIPIIAAQQSLNQNMQP